MAAETTRVTLDIDLQTLPGLPARPRRVGAHGGTAPDVGWLMSFALQTTDPIQTVEVADEMALDYLRNKLELA